MVMVWVAAIGMAVMLAGLCVAVARISFRPSAAEDSTHDEVCAVSVEEVAIRPARPAWKGRRSGGGVGVRGLARHVPDGRGAKAFPGARAVRLGWILRGSRPAELTAIT